jgi:hypothetical protein
MKSYSDLSQSRALSKILPLESADMNYSRDFNGRWFVDLAEYASVKIPKYVVNVEEHLLPCWSLAALLSVLDFPSLTKNKEDEWEVCVPNHQSDGYIEASASNPIDACYEMILKLHELNLL